MKHPFSAARYEAALLERLRWQFRPQLFRVEGTRHGRMHTRVGRSGKPRQLDAAVYRRDELVLVAEAKRHDTRPLDIGRVDGFVGMLDDVGCRFGVLASPRGFTSGAKARAAASKIELLLLTYEEALSAELLPVARRIYPSDWAYHPNLASALLAIQQDLAWATIADKLEEVPFEEWEGFTQFAMIYHPEEAVEFLQKIALNHHDDGWRFNAARLLIEGCQMDVTLRSTLVENESGDADFVALLEEND